MLNKFCLCPVGHQNLFDALSLDVILPFMEKTAFLRRICICVFVFPKHKVPMLSIDTRPSPLDAQKSHDALNLQAVVVKCF